MKEWIYKDGSGEYVLTADPEIANLAADAVEVPDGGNYRTSHYFWEDMDSSNHFINGWCDAEETLSNYLKRTGVDILWQRKNQQEKCADKLPMEEALEFAEELRNMGESGWSKEKHSHYKKDVSHLNVIDPYRIADLYGLHPCADHIAKKALCTGKRGYKDLLRDIQDIIDTAERWKEMIEEDNREV